MVPPFYPIVCFGKDVEDLADVAVGDDESTFTLNGHAYSVGFGIFVSKADDTENQWLGDVTATTTNTITTRYPTNSAKGAGAKFWTFAPGQVHAFTTGATEAEEPVEDNGWVATVSDGGVIRQVRLAQVTRILNMTFSEGREDDWRGYKTFRKTWRRGGGDPFSLAWYDLEDDISRVDKVVHMSRQNSARMGKVREFRNFPLQFFVAEEDTFVLE
jgi:hypothetical protein